jgi:hypothetical protein
MKSINNLVLTTCFFAVLLLTSFVSRNVSLPEKETMRTSGKGFAVLELFTSEGCSSCPPADNLMAKIQQEANGEAVYVLAYHVDYWDRQGWKDMYSSADFSNRQIQYGRWLSVSPIYTPQVILNGKFEFVGSNESAIKNAINVQLASNPGETLSLQAHQDGQELTIGYQTIKAEKDGHLLIAVIQKEAQTKVLRGENAGHTLSHVQIVRKLQNEALSSSGSGSIKIELPKGFDAQNWEVLGLLQDQRNGEILAVAKAPLNIAH